MSARRWLTAILGAQLALALTFAWLTPAWEAPDEPWHLGYVTWLKEQRSLPPIELSMLETWVHQEASQPPLYYVLAALASAPWDTSGMEAGFRENPGRWGGVGLDRRNHNYALHGPWDAALATPLMRGLLAARLVAAAFGLLATWATYRLARSIAPAGDREAVALGAAGMVAFLPQLAFLSGAASNDTTAAALCTVALWRAVVLLRAPTRRSAALLGIVTGLALLSKSSALALLPVVGLAALLAGARGREADTGRPHVGGGGDWPTRLADGLRLAAWALAAAALVGGWWYIRNLLLYDTLNGALLHLAMPWARQEPASLAKMVADDELWVLFISSFAAFGWGTIRYPEVLYQIALGICVAAALGLVVAAGRRARRLRAEGSGWRDVLSMPNVQGLLLILLFALLVLAALLGWMRLVRAHWGRLYFPTVGALAVMTALGLHGVRPRWRLPLVAAGAMALWGLSAPWLAIRPALLPPEPLGDHRVAALPGRLDWRIGDVAELVAVHAMERRASADGYWTLTVCLRPLRRTEEDLQLLVHLVAPGDRLVASYHSVPADGTAPTTAWTPGTVFCDALDLAVEEDVPAPGAYDVIVGLFAPLSMDRLPITDATGASVASAKVARLKVAPPATKPTPTLPTDATQLAPAPRLRVHEIAEGGTAAGGTAAQPEVELEAFAVEGRPACPGDTLTLKLWWRALREPPLDLQVLLHLRSEQGAEVVAQADGPVRGPLGGPYETSLWSVGERVLDIRTVELPADLAPGRYRLVTGMYLLGDLRRAPVSDAPPGSGPQEILLPTVLHVRPCPPR